MPRYFFDVVENGRTFRDKDGMELSGPEEACAEAAKALPTMTRDLTPSEDDPPLDAMDTEQEIAIEVRDEEGHYIARSVPEASDF